jgi:biopolymer transport protein ExbD
MALKTRNKLSITFSLATLSNIVLLLLIFFMLTSTLVAPNAIKLLLPGMDQTSLVKKTVTVYINEKLEYFLDDIQFNEKQMAEEMTEKLRGEAEATFILRADNSVPMQNIIEVMDAVNEINRTTGSDFEVILATHSK